MLSVLSGVLRRQSRLKGWSCCRLVGLATHTENEQLLLIYQCRDNPALMWARPLKREEDAQAQEKKQPAEKIAFVNGMPLRVVDAS